MKKIMLIFVLLFSITLFSQNKLNVSTELEPLVIEFVNEAAERDLQVFDYIVENVDWIILTDRLPANQYGGLDRENKVIYIRNGIEVMEGRITLFHEFGHLFTDNSHPCDVCTDIMSKYGQRDHSYYFDRVKYEQELDKLFDYIKNFKK